MNDQSRNASDPIVKKIKEHQWTDWRELRFKSIDSKLVKKRMDELAGQIRNALERVAEDATQGSDSDAEAVQEKSRNESEKQDSKQIDKIRSTRIKGWIFSEPSITIDAGDRVQWHGNIWEWVQDNWHGDYNGATTDGSAWESSGSHRVFRGGCWGAIARCCRSAIRYSFALDSRCNYVGFRLLRIL